MALFRHGTIITGPGRGLRFDPGPSNPEYATGENELPVQEALANYLQVGGVFYDVGANVGFMSVLGARLVGPTGLVYAFEPVQANSAYVSRNAGANHFAQVRIVRKAISNRCGAGLLNLAKYSGGAALASVEAPPDADGTIEVDLTTIDELIVRCGFRPPHVVKIDVEGAELEVLEGMTITAERHRPVVIVEFDADSPNKLRTKQVPCERWLCLRGYKLHELADSYADSGWFVRHIVAVPVSSDT